MMFFKKKIDWKECLSAEDQQMLAGIIELAKKHRCAYQFADDVKLAQLWCALLEFKKKFDELKESCEKIQLPFKAIVEIGEIEKRKTIEEFVKGIVKPEPYQEEIVQRMVNSLMKF